MAKVLNKRVTAEVEGDFVVFLIGMRINKLWKVWSWLPVFMAMPGMIRELAKNPESGFLDASFYAAWRRPLVVQYWRSFEDLERYARDKDQTHFPAWVRFNKKVGSNGDVGIWQETYRVSAGNFECVYNNMPPTGLAKATSMAPASGRRETAAGRLAGEERDYPAEGTSAS